MAVVGPLFGGLEFIMREAALFAAAGFLLLGISDVCVDWLWLALRVRRGGTSEPHLDALPPPERPGMLAVFIPAWDEAAVIGAMLRRTLAAWEGESFRLYAGCYPNDALTIAAVQAVEDERVRLIVGPNDGPTTKADCLNSLWRALLADELARRERVKAVVLHDAEDVVHPAELKIFASLTERWDLIQLPVLPLVDPDSRWIAGHYIDEFAEAHGKELVVRQRLGAGLPSAGVGCAFARMAIELVAHCADDRPFDAASLTEDYELGLRLAELGCTARFARVAERPGGPFVAVREYFPATLAAAVRQKARWMTGIALLGWDRLGWSGGLAERWMRLRDRQALFASLLLFSGYLSLALWLILKGREGLGGPAPAPLPSFLSFLLTINVALLFWRLAMRFGFVTAAYGWGEGLRSLPRAAVGNFVAVLAALRALGRYREQRRTGRARWDKTHHRFPTEGAE